MDYARRYGVAHPAGETISRQIEADLTAARRMGVSGVPFFVFEQEWAISGAQPVESFLPLFDAAINRRLMRSG